MLAGGLERSAALEERAGDDGSVRAVTMAGLDDRGAGHDTL